MEIFRSTGITAAGGQFDIELCTLKITPCSFHTEVFKTVARHRQVQISRTKKMFVRRNRKRNLLVHLYLRRKYKKTRETVGFIQTEVFKTVVAHRQVQIRAQVATQCIETDKPHKEDVCAASGLSSSSPARKFAEPATRPDRLRVKTPIYLHCIRRWSRTRLPFCRCVCANALSD